MWEGGSDGGCRREMSCSALGANAVIVIDDREDHESSPVQKAEEKHGDVIVVEDSPSFAGAEVYEIAGGR